MVSEHSLSVGRWCKCVLRPLKFRATAATSDDGARVPSVPAAGQRESLSGGERALFAFVPAGAANQRAESADIVRVSEWPEADARRSDVCGGR